MKTFLLVLRALKKAFLQMLFDEPWRKERRDRRWRAKALLSSVSPEGQARLSSEALTELLDAGWHEGRCWEPERRREFEARFRLPYPASVSALLTEFGGLDIGIDGRILSTGGEMLEHILASRDKASQVVGVVLYPVGWTNLLEDDGLGVYLDDSGRVYVDGPTGSELPEENYMVELVASSMEEFLNGLFEDRPVGRQKAWRYLVENSDP